ncbi:MAG: hypothetical protein R3D63_00710 [Paracoccaceae bacterium]
MALAFILPGQASAVWLFPLAMLCCGAATGLTDVLMNARTAQIEQQRGSHLMNLAHAACSLAAAGGALATGSSCGWGWGLRLGERQHGGAGAGPGPGHDRAPRPDRRAGQAGQQPGGGGGWPGAAVGGGMVLVAFMTENAAENWSALSNRPGGSPAEGAMGRRRWP